MLVYKIFYPTLLFINILLVSCSNTHVVSNYNKHKIFLKWIDHKNIISKIFRYQINGHFIYKYNDKEIYGRFEWEKVDIKCYYLTFTDPFRLIKINLNIKKNCVSIIDSYGKKYNFNNNLEEILTKLIGVNIPFNELEQWILGLPGSAINFTLDRYGRLKTVNYPNNKNWFVRYKKYHNNITPILPYYIELYKDNEYITLEINNWNLS